MLSKLAAAGACAAVVATFKTAPGVFNTDLNLKALCQEELSSAASSRRSIVPLPGTAMPQIWMTYEELAECWIAQWWKRVSGLILSASIGKSAATEKSVQQIR